MVNIKHQSHLDAIRERPKAAMDSAKPFQQLLPPGLGSTTLVADLLSNDAKEAESSCCEI